MAVAPEREAGVRTGPVVALLLLSVVGVYSGALDVPFLWDDRALVLDQPSVREGQPIARYFTRAFWPNPDQPRSFYRPLVTLSYRLDYLLHGPNAAGFHLTNLAFHVLSTLLVFALGRRFGAGRWASLLAAASFAFLPRLTEGVTWISGRTDVLASSFVLAALLVWPAPRAPRRLVRAALGSLLILGGFACKEVALAGVVAIMTLELTTPDASLSRRDRAAALALLGACSVGFLSWRSVVLGPGSVEDGLHGAGARLVAAASSWGTYAWMWIDPFQPSLQVGRFGPLAHVSSAAVVAGALFVLATTALLAINVRRRNAPVAALLAMGATALALVAHVIPFPVNVLCADRFLYLPTAALTLTIAVSVGGSVRARGGAAAVVTAWIIPCAFATFARNSELSDELGLWTITAERGADDDTVAVTELGNVLFRHGEWEESSRAAEAVVALDESESITSGAAYLDALANLANGLVRRGDYEGNLRLRQRIAADHPGSSRALLDLARAELHLLHFESCREAVRRASASASEGDAEVRALAARIDEVFRIDPGPADALDGASRLARARLDAKAGRPVEAVRDWTALVARPDLPADAVLEGAVFLTEEGPLEAAEAAVARARREPGLSAQVAALEDALNERRRFASHMGELLPRIRAISRRLAERAERRRETE